MRTHLTRLIVLALCALMVAPPAYASRLFTSGYEIQSTTNGVEWYTGDVPIAACAINTTTNRVRTGAASLRCTNPTSGTPMGQIVRLADPTDGTDRFGRACVFIDTLPDVNTTIMGFGNTALSNTAGIRLNTDGTLTVRIDNNPADDVGPSAATLSAGQYYCLELRIKRDAAPDAGADQVEVRIDGSAQADLTSTNRSIASRGGRFLVGLNLNATESAETADLYFDDVAVNNDSGTSQASWPGVGSVVTLFPNGAGEFEQTITLNGSAPESSAWASTDDGTATGTVDTVDYATFTSNSADWTGLGSRFAIAMEDLPFADAVALVAFGLRISNAGAGAATYTLGAQTSNGGTKSTSPTQNFDGNTTWHLNNASATRVTHQWVLYADPDSAAWTRTSVNNLQYLVRSTDASPNINIGSAWLTVEFTPGEEPAPSECSGLALLGVGC